MSVHIKIVLPPQSLSGSALMRLQGELGIAHLAELEAKIAGGEPILDRMPPRHLLEEFIRSTASLVHVMEVMGVVYQAWVNGDPATPQHLRSVLSHKQHVLKSLHDPDERPHRHSLEED